MLLHPHLPVVWSPYNFLIVLAETRRNNWRDCLHHRGDTGRESQRLMCLRVLLTSLLLCNAAGPSGWSAEWIPKSRVKASVPQQFISLCKGNKKFSKSLLLISRLVSLSPTPHPQPYLLRCVLSCSLVTVGGYSRTSSNFIREKRCLLGHNSMTGISSTAFKLVILCCDMIGRESLPVFASEKAGHHTWGWAPVNHMLTWSRCVGRSSRCGCTLA